MDVSSLAMIALIVSIIAGIIGIFGGVPGIKSLFFSKPSLEIQGFMPVIVFDKDYDLEKEYPKFSLKGILKVYNPNNYDISIIEMKIYGMTQDSSGKYKFPGNKPIIYKMNIPGTLDSGEDIVKAYRSSFLKFHFAHFENTQEPGIMHAPMKSEYSKELGHPVFHIYLPSYNQLFKHNKMRRPYSLVDEVAKSKLYFAFIFNNELIKIAPSLILNLCHCQNEDWERNEHLISIYNANKNMKVETD